MILATLRRLFATVAGLLALLWLSGTPAYAELKCQPLEQAVRSGDAATVSHAHGMLWRVTKPGIPANHVFGTIHLGDPEIVALSPEINAAFEQSREIIMEIKLDDLDLSQFAGQMTIGGGESLEQTLGPDLYARTAALLEPYGIPKEAAGLLKPWAAYMTLMTPPGGGLPLDMVLAMRATEAVKPIVGLESPEEQFNALSSLSEDDQVALLRDTVCHYEALQADIVAMKRLYLARDLGGLVAISERYTLSDSPRYQRLMQQLLTDRNRKMVERMSGNLARGGAFVAVGALHLPGEQGILGRLESAGYKVEAVY